MLAARVEPKNCRAAIAISNCWLGQNQPAAEKKEMDEAFTNEKLERMSGMQAMHDRVMRVVGRNPTARDFLSVTRRGRPREASSEIRRRSPIDWRSGSLSVRVMASLWAQPTC
jgi:hypothetical protein